MNNLESNLWLVVYLLAWIVFFVSYQKKRKIFDAGSFILCTYILYAFLSWRLFNSPGTVYNKPIHLFPFIYLFIMLLLATSTVLKYDVKKISGIQRPNSLYFLIVSLFFVVPSLIHSPSTISHIQEGIVKMVVDSRAGNEMYREAIERSYQSGTGGVSNIMAIFSSAFYNIGVLLTFYYLTLSKRNKWLSAALILSTLIGLLVYVSLGQRGGVILRLFTIIVTYFAFKTYYPQKVQKILKYAGIIVVVLVSVPIVLITMSRFGSDEGSSFDSALQYAGQENINFNYYGLNDGGVRYGDRTAPLFKKMIGFQNVPDNYWQRRDKYPQLKMDDDVFYTFVGDFTIDYGPIIAVFLFLIFTALFLNATKVKGKQIKFHQLILVHFVMCICAQGGMSLFSFSDTAGNLQIIVVVIAYFLFKIDYQTSLNNKYEPHSISNSSDKESL